MQSMEAHVVLTLIHIIDDTIIAEEKLFSSLAEAQKMADLRISAGIAARIDIFDEGGSLLSRRTDL